MHAKVGDNDQFTRDVPAGANARRSRNILRSLTLKARRIVPQSMGSEVAPATWIGGTNGAQLILSKTIFVETS
jgi:hypothetical protein